MHQEFQNNKKKQGIRVFLQAIVNHAVNTQNIVTADIGIRTSVGRDALLVTDGANVRVSLSINRRDPWSNTFPQHCDASTEFRTFGRRLRFFFCIRTYQSDFVLLFGVTMGACREAYFSRAERRRRRDTRENCTAAMAFRRPPSFLCVRGFFFFSLTTC